MKTKGMFWHIHHGVLLEWSDDINERIDYIKKNKPKDEQQLRLKLMKPVKGKLPIEVVKAWEAYDKAREAYDKAWEALDKAREALVKAWEARGKAREARGKAWEAYYKACKKHRKAIEALHRKECKNCPWDGKTIFPEVKP